MYESEAPTRFTPLQQELLKLYSRKVSEEDLIAIKDMIGKYFLDKLQKEVDQAVERKGYTQDDFDEWLEDTHQ